MIDLFGLTPAKFETLLLVFVRVSIILVMIPVFSANQIPRLVRVGFAILVTIVIYPTVPLMTPFKDLYGLGGAVLAQLVIGTIFGYVSYLIFMGIQLAGEVLDIQVGFAIVNVINPFTQQNVSVLGEFVLVLATLLFLISDGHHLLLEGIGGSFNLLPLPWIGLSPQLFTSVIAFTSAAFLILFKIATPISLSLFVANVALGLMARVAPQMNVFIIGFPLQIGIGLIMLAVSLPLLGVVLPGLYNEIPRQLDTVMRELRPQ